MCGQLISTEPILNLLQICSVFRDVLLHYGEDQAAAKQVCLTRKWSGSEMGVKKKAAVVCKAIKMII